MYSASVSPVFRRRPRSLREVLVDGAAFGDRDLLRVRRRPALHLRGSGAAGRVGGGGLRDRHGVGNGDRVAVCAANCPEWLLTFWAVAALDAVLVAMNGWWTGTEMRIALELTGRRC